MLKKKKRKHLKHKDEPTHGHGGRFRLLANPLTGVDPEGVKAAVLALAAREAEQFPKLLQAMLDQLKQTQPPLLIAIIAYYSLQAGVSDNGDIQSFNPDVMQHHVEVLQALALTLTVEEWGSDPSSGEDVAVAMKTLKQLADAFHYRRFGILEDEHDDQARAVVSMQEKLRIHTQAVRNWGSFSQVVRIVRELYSPLDDALRAQKGFSATDLITTAENMTKLLEARSNERFRWMQRVWREHKPRKIIQAYYKHHPTAEGDPDEFLKTLPAHATREQILFFLMQHADLLSKDDMMFDPVDLAARSGVPTAATARILEALGKKPGDLKGANPEHFFMGNPTWEYPVIVLDDKYLCVMPQAIFSHIHRIMHRLAGEAGILPVLEARRSKYLEDKVADVLANAFPDASIRSGTKWRLGAVEYETDHLVVVDKVAVIVEDKSHSLTERGLRGAPERVREHVRDLIGAPSEQSTRLATVIWRAKAGEPEATTSLVPFGVDFSGIERVIRVNVTLDDLTVLSLEETELKAAGWIRPDLDLAPTMTVADLETVADILESQSFLLHYFSERQRVQTEGRVMADEIDLLGVYLKNGLNMGNLEEQKLEVMLTGASAAVDHYYNSGDAGISVTKPRPELSRYYANLVDAMEEKAFPGWSIATIDLLRSAVFEEQIKIEKALAKLKVTVERNIDDPLRECCLVVRSHPLKDTAVIFLVYPPKLAPKRKEVTQEMATQILDEHPEFNRCVVITRDTSRWSEPYASVYFTIRPNVPAAENSRM